MTVHIVVELMDYDEPPRLAAAFSTRELADAYVLAHSFRRAIPPHDMISNYEVMMPPLVVDEPTA